MHLLSDLNELGNNACFFFFFCCCLFDGNIKANWIDYEEFGFCN